MVSDRLLYKAQAATGLFFGGYLVMHFLSHLSLLLGWERGLRQLRRFRVVYQFPPYEALLFLSLLAHVAISAYFVLRRRLVEGPDTDKKEGGLRPAGATERTLHRYAGYVMAASIGGHVLSTRVVALLFLKNPDLYDYTMIFVENRHFRDTLAAFLMVFAAAGAWHLIYGSRLAVAVLRDRAVGGEPFPAALKMLYAAAAVLLAYAVLAASGHVYPVRPAPHVEVAAEHIHRKMTLQA